MYVCVHTHICFGAHLLMRTRAGMCVCVCVCTRMRVEEERPRERPGKEICTCEKRQIIESYQRKADAVMHIERDKRPYCET